MFNISILCIERIIVTLCDQKVNHYSHFLLRVSSLYLDFTINAVDVISSCTSPSVGHEQVEKSVRHFDIA
jgi:hypothetical protein